MTALPHPPPAASGDARRQTRPARDRWLKALELTAKLDLGSQETLPVAIERLAETHGGRPALISDRQRLTYGALAARARAYSRWALAEGIAAGDTVALMMPNAPEYLAVWLGITRVGGVVALLNSNLAGGALAHCIKAADPRHVIVADGLTEALAGSLRHLDPAPAAWAVALPGTDDAAALPDGFRRLDADALPQGPLGASEVRPVRLADRALCIYTSGTTGLPKAANVSHHRIMSWARWFAGIMDADADDRMYDCLPMYHSVGGVVAPASLLVSGGSVVIREKFSASRFFDDIVRHDCTLFQYIGELCRYLLASPPDALETAHRLRLACGNGLRREVWTAFQERFRIPDILEFYAATEGTFSLYNLEGVPGSIGRVPAFLQHRFPAAIVRSDPATGEPLRGSDGRCVRAARNEAGEAIGRIAGGARFEGYTDAGASEKKVLRDVFDEGDAWFRTGDLMRQDEKGFFTFVDRVGGSFRWKGENVSSLEVQEAVLSAPGVAAAQVYGVEVPGAEGRAGMAAIVPGEGFSPEGLRAHLAERLPAYARPLFLRIVESLEMTETFKPKTGGLAADGFDPTRIADPLHVDHPDHGAYVRLDACLHAAIVAGTLRL